MINNSMKKLAKNSSQYNNVYWSKDNKQYWSANGHTLLVEKTLDNFEENKAFDPITETNNPDEYKIYCNYLKVIPCDNLEDFNFEGSEVYKLKEKKPYYTKILIKIKELFYSEESLKLIFEFFGNEKYKLEIDKKSNILKFQSDTKTAVLINIIPVIEKYENVGLWDPKVRIKKPKLVYVVVGYDILEVCDSESNAFEYKDKYAIRGKPCEIIEKLVK